MLESELKETSWGYPTSIEKSKDYDVKRSGYRYILYKWEVKDSSGFIVKIRDAYVKEGVLVSVHEYNYTNPKAK